MLAQKSSLVMLWPEPNQRLFGKQFVSAHLGWNTRHEKPMSVHATATSDGNIQVKLRKSEDFFSKICELLLNPKGFSYSLLYRFSYLLYLILFERFSEMER